MGFTVEQIRSFRCPRWLELPGLSLYMDQVVLVLEEVLGMFADEKERVLTSTMVNNYVKQKLLRPPDKKKYGRDHMALLIMITLLKKVLSMGEIEGLVQILFQSHGEEAGYNLFCDRLEMMLDSLFAPEGEPLVLQAGANAAVDVLDAALIALCGKLLTHLYLQGGQEE